MPSDSKAPHDWQTRTDPFAAVWDKVKARLDDAPELEAKTLFDWLCREHEGMFQEGQLRTLQRRIHDWRALQGPEREVFFPQIHHPGQNMQLDFTSMNAVGITIDGAAYPHLFCHCVLTYSNREWGTPCPSESMLTIRHGFQSSIFRLGHTPATLSTDSSTAATHKPVAQLREDDIQAVRRVFNSKYLDMLSHFGVKPRVITLGEPHENGDVESLNGAFKRRVERLHGRNRAQINYRHLIGSLSRKPGALRNYRYCEEMFPTLRFRMAYDLLCETCSERTADVEYVRILALAANTVESAVDETLGCLIDAGLIPRMANVEELIPRSQPVIPAMHLPAPDLTEYDAVLGRICQ